MKYLTLILLALLTMEVGAQRISKSRIKGKRKTDATTKKPALETRERTDNVLVYGILKNDISAEPIDKAIIKIIEDKKHVVKLSVDHDSAYYAVQLEYGHVYDLEYRAHGFVSKSILIDTREVPMNTRASGFGLQVDVLMLDPQNRKNFRFLRQNPVGTAEYNDEIDNFEWDMEHVERMRQMIAHAKNLEFLP